MDLLSIFGVILAFSAILGGNYLEGGHIQSLFNGPAAMIVIGGTVAAIMLQTPFSMLKRGLIMLKWVFMPPYVSLEDGIEKVVSWSMRARKEGLLGLESAVEKEDEAFAQKGLQLLVDGSEPEVIRNVLELDLVSKERYDLGSAKIYDGMGGYSPTIGIIGAVMGLIHVMSNLADPSSLGSGIATAFVATIYGVAFANLFFFPIGAKLKTLVQKQSQYREMLIEGLVAIAEGENPRSIEMKLRGFIT
ncbi:MAG: chemotaxis protein MotA [Oleiphilaceae bacterium]|jgi:chemotaxis protein MotA